MEVLLFDAVTICDRIFSTSSAANRSIGEIIFVFMKKSIAVIGLLLAVLFPAGAQTLLWQNRKSYRKIHSKE